MSSVVSSLNHAGEAWWSFVLAASWQAAVVGLSVLLALRFGRRWPAPLRYGLLLIALGKFACPPMMGAPTGLFSHFASSWRYRGAAVEETSITRVQPPASPRPAVEDVGIEPVTDRVAESAPAESPAMAAESLSATAETNRPQVVYDPQEASSEINRSVDSARPHLNWPAWLMLSHLAGMVLVVGWTAWQLTLLRRMVSRSREITSGPHYELLLTLARKLQTWRTPRLLASPEAASPMALGAWRPTIVVPERLLAHVSADDLQTVLAHEIAHLHRGDLWVNWLRIVIVAAWWFHPVVWPISRALRRVHEDCCDDLLLVGGVTTDAAYCETLLRVASQVHDGLSPGMAPGMAHRLHPLGDRLLRIMDRTVLRRARLSPVGACLLALLTAVLLPGVGRHSARASADDAKKPVAEVRAEGPQAETRQVYTAQPATTGGANKIAEGDAAVAGIVSDGDGRPVAEATIWLLGGSRSDELLARRADTISDEQGRFSFRQFTADQLFKRESDQQFPTIIVRDKNHRLGWIFNFQAPLARKIKLKLHEVADFRGQFVDLSGRPIAGAKIRPESLNAVKVEEGGFLGTLLTRELAEQWETTTADNGRFTLSNVPLDGSFTARVTAAGFGSPLVVWNLGKDVTIRLGQTGRIVGAVEMPDKVVEPIVLTLDVRRQPEAESKGAAFRVDYSTSAAVAPDRSFEFRDLPPGSYVVSLKQEPPLPVFGDPTPPITVSAGEHVADVKFVLHRGMVVRGVAIDNRAKQPLKHVMLRLETIKSNDPGQYVTTDEHGRFTAYVRPGELRIQPWQTPPGHLPALFGGPFPTIEVKDDIETTVEVEHAVEVAGVVVDEQGRPVDGAELQLAVPWRVSRHGSPATVRSDASGKFTLKDVDPADNLSLRVRSRTAASNGVILLQPVQLGEPLHVQVSQANASRVIGRVLDEAGVPLKHVTLSLNSQRGYDSRRIPQGLSMSTGVFIEEFETDDAGRFRSTAVWPRDSYQVVAVVDGYDRAESQRLTATAGETLDLGTIVLRRTNGFVAGRIVDSSGKPLQDVTVFNSGDGLQPVSTVTDASGRFRLQGLFRGSLYVFARKPGYRFTGTKTYAGLKDVELTMLTQSEPPPVHQPAAPPDETECHELARWMLEQFWQISREADKWLLIRYMARLDPDQAAKWSAELGGRNGSQITIGVCERIDDLSRDPLAQLELDDTLAAVAGLGDSRAAHLLIDLAERTLKDRPIDAMRYSEEALLRVRKLIPPERIWCTAELGNLFSRLGRTDAGQKLLGEAADAAEQHSADNRAAFARGMVARELAKYDLPRAKKLIEPISAAAGQARYLSWLAESLAENKLNEALAIVAQIGGGLDAEMLANTTRMKIAYRIAPARLQEALRIVDEMHGHSAGKTRAEALSWIAVQVAANNKTAAFDLIDRSLAIYLDEPDEFRSWTNYGGRPVFAAWVARQARAIGYPDMRSVVMRVLAARPTAREESNPVRRLEASVATAWVLAFSDTATSRDLLRAVEPSGELIGSGYSSVHRGEWLNAWALADPDHAKEIFKQELARLKDHPDFDLQRTGLLRAAEMLSQPQSQWPRHLLINFGPFWLPGEE